MATTVGSHSVSTFNTPVNGGPLDANVVRGNDNTIRTAYVAHDSDTGIHVQSSSLASRPAAGTAGRKWITVDTGSYKLWYDDGTTWHEVGAATIDVFVVAGENLVKGDVVKVTGYNNGLGAPTVAKVASASDVAFGIMNQAVTNGATGYLTNTGIIADVATNTFNVGDILYPNTSGGLTTTKPTSGNYQVVAYVLRSNANNGVLYVEFSAPRIVERSDNTASTIVLRDASGNFSAGTITAGALTSTGLVTFASLKGTGATTVTNILDEDNMASDSATALATQQSIKAYVDAQVGANNELSEVLANGNITGLHDIIVTAGQKITTDTIDETTSGAGVTIDSVLLKDDVVNATDIETGTISANNGALAITIANTTGALTLASALADSNLATISTAGKVSNSATTATNSNTASAIVARDGSGDFSAGTITATLSGTATQVSQALTAGSYLTSGGTYNGSTARTFAVDATDANTASKVVARDASGNFAAGTITATLNGAAPAGSLSGNTLASGVTASSLTSVGTLTSLTVSGNVTVDTNTLFVDATNNAVLAGTTTATNNIRANQRLGVVNVGAGQYGGIGVTSYSGTTADASPLIDLTRSRGTSDGSFTAVVSDDNLGSIVYRGSTGSAFSDAAQIQTFVDGTLGTNIPGRIVFKTAGTNTAATERMRLDSSGNLGLGVTPSAWFSGIKAFQVNTPGAVFSSASGNYTGIANNYYVDAFGNDKFLANGRATSFLQNSGSHIWYTSTTSNSSGAGAALTFTQAMTLDASGNLGVGTTSPAFRLSVISDETTYNCIGAYDSRSYAQGVGANLVLGGKFNSSGGYSAFALVQGIKENATDGNNAGALTFSTRASGAAPAERARITAGGSFLVNATSEAISTTGFKFRSDNTAYMVAGDESPLYINRRDTDGTLVQFCQGDAVEGTISVSGNTVSYNAFAGSHWSQLEDGSKPEILRGTVMEALDELCEWPGEQNERLPKAKVSDTAGSKKVYGVFMDWDNDWTETNDMYVTAVGAFICRVAADVVVEQGDLLESNGDGTARVQADDVIRSSTIGKVTSTVKTHEYEDGTYCVPTVLYCG